MTVSLAGLDASAAPRKGGGSHLLAEFRETHSSQPNLRRGLDGEKEMPPPPTPPRSSQENLVGAGRRWYQ